MSTLPSDELKLEIKNLMMSTLNIADVDPDDVVNSEPLFGGTNALTLDSVDGIEIIMALQRKYNIRLNDQNLARHIIQSVDSIAEFVSSQRVGS